MRSEANMTSGDSSNTSDDIRRRGEDVYNRVVLPQVDDSQKGKVVAIDVVSEAFAIDDTALAAADRLREHHADAVVWLTRIGYRALHNMRARPRERLI